MSNRVVIISAARTPIGSFGGGLKSLKAPQLGAFAVKAVLDRAGVDAMEVNDLLMGAVIQANMGQAPARQVARFAGLPDHVNCTTVNKVCASGMKSIMQATQSILLGDASVVIAGGMESMSNVPFYAEHMRWGQKYGHVSLLDGLQKDGLTDVYDGNAMGIAAELCANECNISRQEQDQYAIESYRRSQLAWQNGSFQEEVVPVIIPQKKGEPLQLDKDEEPFQVKFDKIPGLAAAFKKDGTITAANASTMNDGAAALLLMSESKAKELGLKPLAYISGYADAEQAPEWFTTTPSLAIPKALEKAGLRKEQIDYWEINEAFSVVAIENRKRLGIDSSKLNVHGGAVSLGHPLGCSGARIIVTLLHILQQKNARYGVGAICNGGGGASALVIENLQHS